MGILSNSERRRAAIPRSSCALKQSSARKEEAAATRGQRSPPRAMLRIT
jgi:hypothetical protein